MTVCDELTPGSGCDNKASTSCALLIENECRASSMRFSEVLGNLADI
jgi:hypothetical protein